MEAAGCVMEDKLGDFVDKIEESGKFELKGLSEDNEKFVLCDTTKDDGIYGRYIEVDVKEVVSKPADQIIAVLNNERKGIVCQGVTRIVGYYSKINNWNPSKVGELRDRVVSRYDGGYGFNGTGVKYSEIDDAMAFTDNMR